MAHYRKKPVVIEEFCLGFDPTPEWFVNKCRANDILTYGSSHDSLSLRGITTLEVVTQGQRGDFIIKDVQGETYPCKEEIFRLTYEPVGGADA